MPPRPKLPSTLRMSDWAHLRTEFIWVYESQVEACYQDISDHYPGQSALLITQGQMVVETEKGSAQAGVGQWCLPTCEPRRQLFTEDSRVLSLRFKIKWPGEQPLFEANPAIVLDAVAAPKLETASRDLLRQVNQAMPDAASNLPFKQGSLESHFALNHAFAAWACAYVESLLAVGVTPSRLGTQDHRVIHALQILDELPLDVTLDISWLATEVGLSASQLERLFIKQFNLTPRQYFDRRKFERAIDLLHSSPLSVKQIAYELGYHSLPYFSRWFRQKAGSSPKQYQQRVSESAKLDGPPPSKDAQSSTPILTKRSG